jgi:hypothetical protein
LASDDLHTGRVRGDNSQNGKPSAAKGTYQAMTASDELDHEHTKGCR